MSTHGASNFSYLLAGLGIGAIIGLLMAPKVGSETREIIAKKADEGRDYARKKSKELRKDAESYLDKGKDMVAKQKEQLSAALEAGKGVYRSEKSKAN